MSLLPREAANVSQPFIFPPSDRWDGVDGSWSTFIVNIGMNEDGTGGQNFRILISTAGSVTWVPVEADWCTQPDAATCAKNRGVEVYQGQQSLGFQEESSWKYNSIGDLNLAANLDWGNDTQRNGKYGFDTVGLGATSGSSPALRSQVLAEIITQDFFLGIFGLSNLPPQFSGPAYKPFIVNFRDAKQIPSLSYGYTAGASYRNSQKGVTGNLILGGYDSSRFTGGKSINMPASENSSLLVGVQDIVVDPGKADNNFYSASGKGSGFMALIDSTLPYLFLPRDICDVFERIFRLTYDEQTGFYKVNDTARQNNLAMNATITFKIGNGITSEADAALIKLPYAAFDLTAKWPIFQNETRYFPIRRSPNDYYVLGRSFLQEAYIVVDYERKNFTIAQAVFPDGWPAANSNIVPIHPPSDNATLIKTSQPGSSGLSAGGIAGVTVAGVVLLVIIAVLIYFFKRQQIKKKQPIQVHNLPDEQHVGPDPPPYDPTKQRRVSELETPMETPGYASSRTSSQGGYFGGELETPDNVSEEMRMKFDGGFYSPTSGRLRASSEPKSPGSGGSLNLTGPFELPADHGRSEIGSEPQTPQRTRPPMKRRKKSSGSSGGNHSLQGDSNRVEAIAEDPNEGTNPPSSAQASGLARPTSRFQENIDDESSSQQDQASDSADTQTGQQVPRHAATHSSDTHEDVHEEHQLPARPNPRSRMSADEAAGLEGGEPGPILHDTIEPVQRSASPASSDTMTEQPIREKDEMQP